MRYETLDLDGCGLSKLIHIAEKMHKMGARGIRIRDSASVNGFHVAYYIAESKADLIRLVFDDAWRLTADLQERGVSSQNVLWDRKLYRKGSHTVELEAGVWIPLTKLYIGPNRDRIHG